MEKFYSALFSPIQIGKMTVKNRIETAPTIIPMIDEQGYPTDHFIAHYRNRAKGGAGIVTVGETAIDWKYSKTHFAQINIWGEKAGVALNDVTDAIHQYGAKANIELCAGGVWGAPELNSSGIVLGPSDGERNDGVKFKEMTYAEMDEISNNFAEACAICQRCGFDMVMVHGAHSWLLGAFLSPIYNHRTDEYGGSMENRVRFPRMVLERIRMAVGPDFPIEYRISGDELDPNGYHLEDCIEACKLLDDLVDLFHVSVGTRAYLHGRGIAHPDAFYKHGCNAYLGKGVKAAFKEVGITTPVLAVGSLDDPEVANEMIANQEIDMVAIARGIIADPDLPNKARLGHPEDITPCIRCQHCLDKSVGRTNTDAVLRFNTSSTHRFVCSVNPRIGKEHYPEQPLGPSRKVAVVGGGPAGMQAAIECAKRGHKVTIFEKASSLGGALFFADYVSFKDQLAELKEYQKVQIQKLGVEVRLNTEATPEGIEAEHFDAVIAATGATSLIPNIPGVDGPNVVTATEAYTLDTSKIGENIVLVGGGQVGCETALHYAMDCNRKVTVIEMLDKLAPDASFTHREPLIYRMDAYTTYLLSTKCIGITSDGVQIQDAEGKTSLIPADTVILSAGMRPNTAEAEKFRECALQYAMIGDCVTPTNVEDAVHGGYEAALQIC